jgi:hypothetical protein
VLKFSIWHEQSSIDGKALWQKQSVVNPQSLQRLSVQPGLAAQDKFNTKFNKIEELKVGDQL